MHLIRTDNKKDNFEISEEKYLLVTALLWSRQMPVKIMVMTIIMIITMPKRAKIIENQ